MYFSFSFHQRNAPFFVQVKPNRFPLPNPTIPGFTLHVVELPIYLGPVGTWARF